jgi:DNA-binding XRE family transcriptional regulator
MFGTYCLTHSITRGQLAAKLGCSRITLWRLENGKQRPSLELAVTIEKELGIKPSAWPKAPAREGRDAA